MEERKYVIIDTTSVPRNTTNLNASFNRLYDNMKSRGIDITATGLAQCIDVYLRVLCFCKDIRSITDLYIPARERLYCEILDIEIAREDYDKCRCDIDAYSMKDAFITMVTMIVHHRFTQTDIFNIMANVDDIFNEIARFVEEVVDFIVEELEVSDIVNLVDSRIQLSYAGAEGWFIKWPIKYHSKRYYNCEDSMSAIYNWNTNKINIKVKSNMLIPVKTIEYSSDWE